MLNLVRRLVTFLRRWLNDWDKFEAEQLAEPDKENLEDWVIPGSPLRLRDVIYGPIPRRNNWSQIISSFGDPGWGSLAGSALLVSTRKSNKWESAYMTTVRNLPGHDRWSAPGLKKLYVNKAVVKPLTEALRRCVYLQDKGYIPKDWDLWSLGCFNPRRIGYSKNANWSGHAYGIAFDINPKTNARGSGAGTIPRAVVLAFKSVGFYWGGDYTTVKTDPMHFEYWR